MTRKHYEYPEKEQPVDLVVHTKTPAKWLLIDRETGQMYQGTEFGWWDKLVGKPRDIATE